MLENLKFSFGNKKIYLYSIGVGLCLISVFGVIILAAAGTERVDSVLPSPSPTQFADILGAHTQQQAQPPQEKPPEANTGPDIPPPVPSPSPTPSPSLFPSPSPTPSPSPSVSPSPTPTPTPTPAPAANSDTSGPSISEIESINVGSNKATIKWKTNEDADELLIYWKESASENDKKVKESTERKTDHSIELTGLEVNTSYKYKITGKDSHNNSTTSEEKQFKTSS